MMKYSICQLFAIYLIFGLLFTSAIGPSISLVNAHELTKKKLIKIEPLMKTVEEEEKIYKMIEVWMPSTNSHVMINTHVGTRTSTRLVPTGKVKKSFEVETTPHTHWYENPAIIISIGSMIISIISIIVDSKGDG